MTDAHLTVDDMTCPAAAMIADKLGGMVMSVVMAVEIATPDGERHSIALWDAESSIALQIGLGRIIKMVLDARAVATCEVAFESDEDSDG